MICLKTPPQIEILDQANIIVQNILDFAERSLKSGITTKELDFILEKELTTYDATPAFKNYHGFPSTTCISINEEVVHGVPSDRVIKDGDLVSVDFGVYYKGFYGDGARTFIVGSSNDIDKRLVVETKGALHAGIEKMVVGNRLFDICNAIESVAKENKFSVVKGFSGHGIGASLHEEPHVFNYIDLHEPNVRLQEGMVLALEPMFYLGKGGVIIDSQDKWTVRTIDKSKSCHWELCAAITSYGPRILGI